MPVINEINLLDILMSHFQFIVLSQLRIKELHELRNVCPCVCEHCLSLMADEEILQCTVCFENGSQ